MSDLIVNIVLRDAKTGHEETLTCTPEHPLYVQGQGFVLAGQLGIGTSIVTRAGPALQVTDLTWEKNKAEELAAGTGSSFGGYTVYNLTVDGDHTFFVGAAGGGTWVHNSCPNDLHHIFPRKFRADWDRIGVDYDQYTVELERHTHLAGVHGRGGGAFPNGNPGTLPGRYNREWENWLTNNPGADEHDVIQQGLAMMHRYGLDGLTIVPYH